ncbi:hypothetical protein AAMO2058_000390300 [Amorphochlora amoebiformis]
MNKLRDRDTKSRKRKRLPASSPSRSPRPSPGPLPARSPAPSPAPTPAPNPSLPSVSLLGAEGESKVEDDILELDEVPSDTLVAIQVLGRELNPKRVVLRHQIYSLLHDKTEVDKEISRLESEHFIRLFQIPNDCTAVMLTKDYIHTIRGVISRNPKHAEITKRFLKALPVMKGMSISAMKLCKVIKSLDHDKALSGLMQVGVIIRKDAQTFHFSIPDVGPLIIDIRNGRKEIKRLINRRRYKEILLKELENVKLRKTRMPPSYHIRDMHGLSMLEFTNTSVGTLVRVSEP